MIPNHILNDLKPDERVAIFSRGPEIHFHVHSATDSLEAVQAFASSQGAEVLATHMREKDAILAFVAGRERDIGGEG